MLDKLTIVDGTPDHARYIACNMREADVLELSTLGATPIEGTLESYAISDRVWTAMLDDVPVCIFGVASIESDESKGIAWLLGTDKTQFVKKDFLRASKIMIPKMMDGFESLENFVDERNEQSIRWLEWLGFHCIGVHNIGRDSEPYIHYRLEQDNV